MPRPLQAAASGLPFHKVAIKSHIENIEPCYLQTEETVSYLIGMFFSLLFFQYLTVLRLLIMLGLIKTKFKQIRFQPLQCHPLQESKCY